MPTTLDGLLNNRVALEQPSAGYRVAVDTVLLAAAVPGRAGERVLDLGCGVGGVMLALACRVPGLRLTGVEIQPELAALCRSNSERNARQDSCNVLVGDATRLPEDLKNAFDHVAMNPPYHDEARHDASSTTSKRIATTETNGDLPLWLTSAALALKSGGRLTMIHRADRLEEILELLGRNFGACRVKPVLPKEGAAPKRVLITAQKGGTFACVTLPPFVLHNADGSTTDAAEAVLRQAEAIGVIPK